MFVSFVSLSLCTYTYIYIYTCIGRLNLPVRHRDEHCETAIPSGVPRGAAGWGGRVNVYIYIYIYVHTCEYTQYT